MAMERILSICLHYDTQTGTDTKSIKYFWHLNKKMYIAPKIGIMHKKEVNMERERGTINIRRALMDAINKECKARNHHFTVQTELFLEYAAIKLIGYKDEYNTVQILEAIAHIKNKKNEI